MGDHVGVLGELAFQRDGLVRRKVDHGWTLPVHVEARELGRFDLEGTRG